MFQELVFAIVALSIVFVMVVVGLTWYWRKLLAKDVELATTSHSPIIAHIPRSSH